MYSCKIMNPKGDQFELLKKLQHENEKLEEDAKAPPPSSLKKFHSRQGSTSSLLSVNSTASAGSSFTQIFSQEVSPGFSAMSFQGLKSKSKSSSLTALSESWDSWLSLISDWELALKQKLGTQKLARFHQKAADLFKLSWCIPEELRGLMWQLVSGAREENAACVILNPSAAVAGATCLRPSALLSSEQLLGFQSETTTTTKEAVKASLMVNSESINSEINQADILSDFEIPKNRSLGALETADEPLNENPLSARDYDRPDGESKESTRTSSDALCSSPVRYSDLLLLPSPHEKTISRDISRTYPNHSKFKEWGEGQESLFNVARAYSVYDKEVGYCQGSSFIIGLLLMHMPEEDAFGVLVRIMYAYNLRDFFKPTMQALGMKMYQLDHLIQENLADLHSMFSTNGIEISMFSSPWFLTLFATTLPLPLARKAFDAFLCHGADVIFMLGLALLKINQNHLLGLSMEEMVQFLQKDLGVRAESDHNLFFSTAFQFKINSKKMRKLEKEYTEIEANERNRQNEIFQLKDENKKLQKTVEKLDRETKSLADQLVSRQIQCSELMEETSALRHAVASARKLLMEHKVLSASASRGSAAQQTDLEVKKILEDINPDLNGTFALVELESLREELIGCKLREAESNLSIKKLQHEIHEIEKLWNKAQTKSHAEQNANCAATNANNVTCNSTSCSVQELRQTVVTCHVREASLLSELADARLSLASLEHKLSSLEKRNVQLEKQLLANNLEIGSLIQENNNLSDLLSKNENHRDDLSEDENGGLISTNS